MYNSHPGFQTCKGGFKQTLVFVSLLEITGNPFPEAIVLNRFFPKILVWNIYCHSFWYHPRNSIPQNLPYLRYPKKPASHSDPEQDPQMKSGLQLGITYLQNFPEYQYFCLYIQLCLRALVFIPIPFWANKHPKGSIKKNKVIFFIALKINHSGTSL
jgi:hypothetical protein